MAQCHSKEMEQQDVNLSCRNLGNVHVQFLKHRSRKLLNPAVTNQKKKTQKYKSIATKALVQR